jgi:Domain of Unknown Function (DUF326)
VGAVRAILGTHPTATPDEALFRAIDECLACAITCSVCADACLEEEEVRELAQCVRVTLDCADVCDLTGRLLARQSGRRPTWWATALSACAESCRRCAEECEQHAEHHAHCRVCAEACRRCEQACVELIDGAPTPTA